MPENESIRTPAHRGRERSPMATSLLLGLMLATSGCTDPAGWSDSEGLSSSEDAGLDEKIGATTRYEAENRTAQSGCGVASNQTGFTGSGFMDFGGKGTWIEWNNINATQAGEHDFAVRYANAGVTPRPAAITLNGQAAGTLAFGPTGNWSTWATVTLKLSLRAGSNTIRITANTDAGGANLDHATVAMSSGGGGGGGGSSGGTTGGGTTGGAQVRLPIEVLGPAGTKQEVQVQVDDPAGVTHLYLRCNSCGYHDSDLDGDPAKVKATVSVNGSTPVSLKRYTGGGRDVGNKGIEVIGAEANYGGIGGVFRTVRMKVPVSGIRRGLNTITFVHNTPAPPSIGFRIIELNLLRGQTPIIPPAKFAQDDPASWRPPVTGTAAIDQGRALWTARDRLTDPGVDAINGSAANGSITASCADCHARDGRDLKYFNFSNRSIIERSVFHRLSRAEGELIASYIRSRPLPHVPAARPWNPPYQPGPGLDSRSTYEWAAGAGVGAILDRDASMAQYLFPNGQSLTEVRRVVDRFKTLNMRELPVSLPMPEWNQWLPLIHPDDAFNTSAAAIRRDHDGNSVRQPYYTELYAAAVASPTPATIGRMTNFVKKWLDRGMTCRTNGTGNGESWRALNGDVLSAIKLPKRAFGAGSACSDEDDRSRADDQAYEITKRGLAAWVSVKQWEIVHGNGLENEGSKQTAMVCAGTCVNPREARGWVVEGRNVFDRPPHFTGHNTQQYYGQDFLTGIAESNSWYHLNMILNSGYRSAMPTHFTYVIDHTQLLQEESGVSQGFRFWASLIKQRQLQTNGKYGVEAGLDPRTAQPHVYYSGERDHTSETQASVGQPLWGYLATAMLQDFLADARRATQQDWDRAEGQQDMQSRSSTNFSPGNTYDIDDTQGRNTYRVFSKLVAINVDRNVLDDLKRWCREMWPNGPWDSLQ